MPDLVFARLPTKPIRLIVPFPPGGSVDTVARLLSPRLGESLGQQVVVENRSGASGNIGMEQAARATPDGYTLLVNTNPLVTNQLLYAKLNYDTFTDFVPISLLCQSVSVMAINPRVPARNLQEFLDLARAKPGSLNFATAGPATNPHVGGELVNYLGKTNIVAVHFKGGGPALLPRSPVIPRWSFRASRRWPRTWSPASCARGRYRAEAVAGLSGHSHARRVGPAGLRVRDVARDPCAEDTPAAAIETLADRVRKVMLSPEGTALFQKNGLDVIASTPDELAAHLKSESAKWQRVFKERGMRAD